MLLYSLPGIIAEALHPPGAKQKLLTLQTAGADKQHFFLEDTLGTVEW